MFKFVLLIRLGSRWIQREEVIFGSPLSPLKFLDFFGKVFDFSNLPAQFLLGGLLGK